MNLSRTLNSLGALSLINFSRKHAEKLAESKSPAVAARAAIVTQKVDALEQTYSARRPLLALYSQTTTAKDEADEALDGAISALSYELLGPTMLKGDRGSMAYRALFPQGNINFINSPVRAELAQVEGIVAYLKANPSHPMAGRAPDLADKAAALEATLRPQAQAEAAYRAAQEVERTARRDLLSCLRKQVYFLRSELEGDEKKVEALFPAVKDITVKNDEPAPQA